MGPEGLRRGRREDEAGEARGPWTLHGPAVLGPYWESIGRAGGGARPALAVSAAYAPDGRLWVVGVDERRRLFVQASTDEGRTWGPRTLPPLGTEQPAAEGSARSRSPRATEL